MMLVRVIKGILSISTVVLVWWVVTDGLHLFTPLVLPSPVAVAAAAWQLVFDPELRLFSGGIYNGNLIGHALISTGRVALGFAMVSWWPCHSGYSLHAVGRSSRISIQFCKSFVPYRR